MPSSLSVVREASFVSRRRLRYGVLARYASRGTFHGLCAGGLFQHPESWRIAISKNPVLAYAYLLAGAWR